MFQVFPDCHGKKTPKFLCSFFGRIYGAICFWFYLTFRRIMIFLVLQPKNPKTWTTLRCLPDKFGFQVVHSLYMEWIHLDHMDEWVQSHDAWLQKLRQAVPPHCQVFAIGANFLSLLIGIWNKMKKLRKSTKISKIRLSIKSMIVIRAVIWYLFWDWSQIEKPSEIKPHLS